MTPWTPWTPWTPNYLAAREQAGTPEGEMFNQHLREMGPAAAAETVAGMFSLCADEDLVADLCCDLQLDKATATAIAGEIHKIRDGMTR